MAQDLRVEVVRLVRRVVHVEFGPYPPRVWSALQGREKKARGKALVCPCPRQKGEEALTLVEEEDVVVDRLLAPIQAVEDGDVLAGLVVHDLFRGRQRLGVSLYTRRADPPGGGDRKSVV